MHAHALRLSLLGLAALASVATSDIPDQQLVQQALPFHGQTAVGADVVPVIVVALEEEADEPRLDALELTTADHVPVPGHVERTTTIDRPPYHRVYELRFVPDAPLAPGNYRLVTRYTATGSDMVYDDTRHEYVAEFSTLSRPVVLGSSHQGERLLHIEFSQEILLTSLREHVSALDAAGNVLPGIDVSGSGGYRHTHAITLPAGTVAVDVADGVLAVDGTPVAGLPLHLDVP